MMEVIAVLGQLISQLGLEHLFSWWNTVLNRRDGLTADDIYKAVNQITNAARAKGSEYLNRINDRLAAMTLPLGVSPSVKDAILRVKGEAVDALKKYRQGMGSIEARLTTLDNRAGALASLPEEVRATLGSGIKENLVKEATQAKTDLENIQKGVEKYV